MRGAESLIEMPLLGRIELMWVWSDYGTDGARQFPTRFRSWLGPELLKDVTVNVSLDSGADAFELPADIDAGDPPEPRAVDAFVPPAHRDSDVETIADGVYRVRSLRPGFHLLFVEFADFVVAVDAPTGWYEMQQIPPMNWSHGDDVDDLSEKYIRLIERTVPGKPIRHLVLTHHHSDHIGGLPAFARQGIDMLAGGPAADMARRAMTAYCPVPAAGPGESSPVSDDTMASVDVVRGVRRISDDTMEMLLVELPIDNPKAEGFLVVYLPKQRLIYATAFIYPVPEAAFPPAESVDLATWFVDWLDRSGLDVDLHYNVHGTGVVEPWHLNKLREIAAERRRPAAGAHAD